MQDSHYKGWVVASMTMCSSTVLHDQVDNTYYNCCLLHFGFQVMQASQALLASQEHLEVRGQAKIALILSRNADKLVETLGKLLWVLQVWVPT